MLPRIPRALNGLAGLVSGERGQALAEYSLILAFVVVALVVALVALAVAISGLFDLISAAMP